MNLLEHFVFFNPKSISRILSENGLLVQQIMTTVHDQSANLHMLSSRQIKSFLYELLTVGGPFPLPWLIGASSLLQPLTSSSGNGLRNSLSEVNRTGKKNYQRTKNKSTCCSKNKKN